MGASTPNDPNKKEEKQNFTDKVKDSLDALKKGDTADQFYRYASSNVRDTVAYVLMLTGLFLLFFQPAYAGALIGVIAGLYFAPEIARLVKDYHQVIDKLGPARSFILAGLLLAFFILAPFVFFGAIVAVAVRQLLNAG